MFTQCSKCETVFRLSAEVLRAAGGQVRCGRCGEVFNALAKLAEDPSAFTTGESAFDLETRADAILESSADYELAGKSDAVVGDTDLPAGVEIAHLQLLDPIGGEAESPFDAIPETAMEFTLPPGELDRIFVESKTGVRRRNAADELPADTADAAAVESASVQVDDEALAEVVAAADAEAAARDRVASQTPPTLDRRKPASGLEVSENVRQAMLSAYTRKPPTADVEYQLARKPRVPLAAWIGGGAILALALTAQLIHANREWLAQHGPLRASLSGVYSLVGVNVSSPRNLGVYQLRQWGVTGDPGAPGTLRVRASLLNTSAQLQEFPLLRVTLANRFGARISSREFKADEYMGKPLARKLSPGEQADATMDILDPGKEAEGFEIDVCLRGTDQKLFCASDASPRAK